MSRTARFSPRGTLVPVDVARLRLCLPFELSADALNALAWLATGGGFELQAGAQKHELVLFDVPRVLAETLNFSPSKELVEHGWVPVAGCGRRGRAIYFVQLRARGFGELRRYQPDPARPALSITPEQLQPVEGSFVDLLGNARTRPELRLRRRLPNGLRAATLAKTKPPAKPSLTRAERGQQRLLARNLSLF